MVLNVALALDVAIKPGVRDPMFDLPADQYKARLESTDGNPITVVFLGSSRTGYGIRPSVVEETVTAETGIPCLAYNLHVMANGPIGEMVHWHRLLERGLRPDVVILEICTPQFSSFTETIPGSHGSGDVKRTLPGDSVTFHGDRMTWDEVQLVRKYGFPAETETDWREANWNPWFGFRFQLLGMLNPTWLPTLVTHHERRPAADLGWKRPFYVTWVPALYQGAIEANRRLLYDRMQEIRFDESPARCFRDLIQSARDHGTIPAVWITPEATAIRAWYTPEVNQRIAKFVDELRIQRGVDAADLRTALPDEAFHDGHHAVASWADEYTRQVTNAVVIKAVEKAWAKKSPANGLVVRPPGR